MRLKNLDPANVGKARGHVQPEPLRNPQAETPPALQQSDGDVPPGLRPGVLVDTELQGLEGKAKGVGQKATTVQVTNHMQKKGPPKDALALGAALGFGAVMPGAAREARQRLVARFGPLREPGVEIVAFEKGAVYRERDGKAWRPVPASIPPGTQLGTKTSGYRPVHYVGLGVKKELEKLERGEETWAHPEGLSRKALDERGQNMRSHAGPIRFDEATGLPLNPLGPTGVAGRGESNLGPILAQDLFLKTTDPSTGKTYAVFILRKDTGRWAMPGGIEDAKDTGAQVPTAVREFFEETAATHADKNVDAKAELLRAFGSARQVFQGVCAKEPRNTDNMWFETTVFSIELPWSLASGLALKGTDDAKDAALLEVTPALIESLHGDHPDYVAKALGR